jgi:nucleoid-associated protein YgaU
MSKRYAKDPRLNLGGQLGTNTSLVYLRSAIKTGLIPIVGQVIATGDDRLDTLAGVIYGDARYWWVLAAASDIGWGMQIPPGTVIKVVDLATVKQKVTG